MRLSLQLMDLETLPNPLPITSDCVRVLALAEAQSTYSVSSCIRRITCTSHPDPLYIAVLLIMTEIRLHLPVR